MLWLGVALWAVGLVLSLLFVSPAERLESQFFMSHAAESSWFCIIVLYCLLLPGFEYCYRGWVTNEKTSQILSLICMLASLPRIWICRDFHIQTVSAVLATLSVLAVASALFFPKRFKGTTMVVCCTVASAVYWIALNLSFCDVVYGNVIYDAIKLFGASMVFVYVIINYDILYAIFLHAVNNIIVALPILFGVVGDEKAHFEVAGATAEWSRIHQKASGVEQHSDTLTVKGAPDCIAYQLVSQKKDCGSTVYLYEFDSSLPFNYRLDVVGCNRVAIDSLLIAMEQRGMIALDTTFEPMLLLCADSPKVDTTRAGTTLSNLILSLRERYEMPIVAEDGLNLNLPIETLWRADLEKRNADEICDFVHERYGFNVVKSPHDKACVVRIASHRLRY